MMKKKNPQARKNRLIQLYKKAGLSVPERLQKPYIKNEFNGETTKF